MIQLKQVTKYYKDKAIFKNLTLEFPENKITCILGESGVGKTTLLNMIANLTAYEGNITYKGKISYIFQEPRLLFNLTVKNNLRFVQPTLTDQEILTMLEHLKIQDKIDSYPKTLSGGEAQRVSIARAFLVEASIILMDEPFSSLDLSVKYKLIRHFKEVWQSNKKTVIFVTHDVDEALMLANDILILKEAHITKRYSLNSDSHQELREQIINYITSE